MQIRKMIYNHKIIFFALVILFHSFVNANESINIHFSTQVLKCESMYSNVEAFTENLPLTFLQRLKGNFEQVSSLLYNAINIRRNNFQIDRSSGEYVNFLGFGIVDKLKSLKNSGGHWIDFGSGTAKAIIDILELDGSTTISKMVNLVNIENFKATGVAYKAPKGKEESLFKKFPLLSKGRFKYIAVKKYIEDPKFPLDKLEQADLITDLYGPYSYSTKVDKVLNIYLRLLKVGGEIYLYHDKAVNWVQIGDVKISFNDWMLSFNELNTGLKIEFLEAYSTIKITKLEESHFEFPSFVRVDIRSLQAPPPEKIFHLPKIDTDEPIHL